MNFHILAKHKFLFEFRGRCGRMVGFTATYAISAYHH